VDVPRPRPLVEERPRVSLALGRPVDVVARTFVGELERREPLADGRDLEGSDAHRHDVTHAVTLRRGDVAGLVDVAE
jgi:hypothetical protein